MNWKKKTLKQISSIFLGCLVLCLVACTSKPSGKESRVNTLPYYSEATFTPHWMNKDDDKLNN
ncbi:MAG: SCO family protein, partial [Saprospiraceae bacterium]